MTLFLSASKIKLIFTSSAWFHAKSLDWQTRFWSIVSALFSLFAHINYKRCTRVEKKKQFESYYFSLWQSNNAATDEANIYNCKQKKSFANFAKLFFLVYPNKMFTHSKKSESFTLSFLFLSNGLNKKVIAKVTNYEKTKFLTNRGVTRNCR